jgi:hypothetical protein
MIAYCTASDAGVDSDGSVKYKGRMQFHPTPTIVAKTRIGGLPTTLWEPNIRQIVDNWQAIGGKLIPHDEAEEIRPEEGTIAVNDTVSKSEEALTEFTL